MVRAVNASSVLERRAMGGSGAKTEQVAGDGVAVQGNRRRLDRHAVEVGRAGPGAGSDQGAAGERMPAGQGLDAAQFLQLAGNAVGPLDFDGAAGLLGSRVERDDIHFQVLPTGLPAGAMKREAGRGVVPRLAPGGGFGEIAHGAVFRPDTPEKGGSHRGVGEVDLDAAGALQAQGALVDAMDAANEESRFEVLEVFGQALLADMGMLLQVIENLPSSHLTALPETSRVFVGIPAEVPRN